MAPPIVSVGWLHDNLGDPNLRVIDATTVLEHDAAGRIYNLGIDVYRRAHISRATYADLVDEFNDSDVVLCMVPPAAKFEAAAGRAGISDGARVVVYDASEDDSHEPGASVWASRLWLQLRYEGFDDVSVLDGGMLAWRRAGLPTSSGAERYPEGHFRSNRREHLVLDKVQVMGATTEAEALIVDSRLPTVYTGERSRGYRRGHIPTAVSLYHGHQVDPGTARLRQPEELREAFGAVGALDPAVRPIFYCGGGVSCAFNALALAVAGRFDGAIYDGSMLEWSADADLPLEASAPSAQDT
jgi:thiosulfate/3-mercaptopyruvate sulfurtransferase